MAEAAASAIGIVSFGLTVCKGLYTYYHAYTSFDSNISSAYESIAKLARTLILLKDSCNDPRIDHERKDRVANCLCSCEDALEALSAKLYDLRIADPEGFREKAKARFKKHAFPFQEQSLKALRDNAVEVQGRLAFAVQILDLAERLKSQRVLDYLETWSSGVTVTVDQISDDTQRLLWFARSDEVGKILQWLSPPDPWTNHHAARDMHQLGTGKWLLDHDTYKEWLGGASRHLWLYGKAGCGKTVLLSTIVEDVQRYCRQAVNLGFALFYFTFSDQGKQSYEALLRSLVAQLGTQECGLPVLRENYDQRHKFQGGLSVQSLESILLAISALYDTVFVVLDAMDECPGETDARSKLFRGLDHLAKVATNLKFLMTSRDIADIRDHMVSLPAERLLIQTRAVDKDIYNYVAQQLSQGQYFRRLKSESLDLIHDMITAKADGMFRWAYCQLQELSKDGSTRPGRVRYALNTLPATLDHTYARMLDRIAPADRGDALTQLRWLAYATRPITLAELQTAVIIRPEDDEVDIGDEGDLGDSLSILSGLIIISEHETASKSLTKQDGFPGHCEATASAVNLAPNTHVRLAHFSVKEYLESSRIFESSAGFFSLEAGACHRFLSQSCLTYLMAYSARGARASTEQDLGQFPLLDYAARKWYEHSRLQSGDDVSREIAFLACEKARSGWFCLYNSYHLRDGSLASSLFCAVDKSLPRVAEHLLNSGEDVNATGPHDYPLLVSATLNGDKTMVKLLLDHGAVINRAGNSHRSGDALYWAAREGSTLTKLLIDHGADVNTEFGYKTPLTTACRKGHQWVVELLLERGARVDTVEIGEYTPLVEASAFGRKGIVELLIANGADVSRPSRVTTPLRAATESGHMEIAAILIQAGATVNVDDGRAVSDALQGGREQSVGLSEAKCATKPTLEQSNTDCGGNPEIAVETLLDRGADVKAEDNVEDNSALLSALRCGYEDVVALLEDAKGANKFTSEQLNEALVRICGQRRHRLSQRAVKLLLDRGADVNAEDCGALLGALLHGNEGALALLEARGAKKPTLLQLNKALIEACDDRYHMFPNSAVQLLLDRGASANAESGRALLDALRSGHAGKVAVLEARGANEPTLEQLNNALVEVREHADRMNAKTAIEMLLDRGAGANAADSRRLFEY